MGCLKLPYRYRGSVEKNPFYGKVCPEKNGNSLKKSLNAYQYHLKDHLGNTRLTFTTVPKTHEFTLNYESNATLPDDEASFDNLQNIINADLHDHTDAGSTYDKSQLLNGANNGIVGSVLTIPVGKGDQINASVYAKYLAATGTQNASAAVSSLVLAAITGSTGSTSYEGAINNSVGADGSLVNALGTGTVSSTEPMAFINLMFLPENLTGDLTSSNFSYEQISAASSNNHAILELPETFEVPSNGHVVVYISNESDYLTEVYFDDLNITVNESKVIQTDSYTPFGLTFNSYKRVTNLKNNFLFNQGTAGKDFKGEEGKFFRTERITDLGLNWDMTKFRTYDYTTGRFMQVDPLGDAAGQESWTTYQYAFNNPIRYNDPNGDCIPCAKRYITEGFRRLGDAALSLVSATAEVFTSASRDVPTGSKAVSVTATTKSSFFVKADFSDVLNPPANNELVLPNNMVEVGTKTTQSLTTKAQKTTKVGNVPVNTSLSTTLNSTDQSVKNSAEISVGVDNGNVQGKAFVNTSSTTNSDGSKTNKTSIGVKAQVPVYKDLKNTVSVGAQLTLDHEH